MPEYGRPLSVPDMELFFQLSEIFRKVRKIWINYPKFREKRATIQEEFS